LWEERLQEILQLLFRHLPSSLPTTPGYLKTGRSLEEIEADLQQKARFASG
jgi:hypothetical protein